jgi:hypothetical protein
VAHLYSNENFPLPVVDVLRRLGHDVLTVLEAGKAEQSVPDDEVLIFAISLGRAANRKSFDLRSFPPLSSPFVDRQCDELACN